MDRMIKIFAGLLITITIGLLGGAGFFVYRLFFYQPGAPASTAPAPAEAAANLPQDWKAVKSESEKMKDIFLSAVKNTQRAAEMEMEAGNTWQSLTVLEKEGRRVMQVIADDYEKRIQDGNRTEQQVQEAMRDVAKQYDLSMVYVYGHLWPAVLRDLTKLTLNMDSTTSIAKFGVDWKEPLPLESFSQAAADLRVWPLQNNLLASHFGESTTVEIYSR